MPPSTPITDPGVTVATGDPEAINTAGNWHQRLASTLEAHSALIKSTASFLLNGWNGEASTQYQGLSRTMAGHYDITAAEARATAGALRKFASELGTAQGEGKVALKEAIHWMNQVNHWQNKLEAANTAKATAEKNVQTAMSAVVAASHSGAGAATAAQAARNQLQTARNALAKAETDQSTATKNLKTSADHFTQWQKKGGQALQNAEKAAGVAGLALGAVAIASPQVAGLLNTAANGMSTSSTQSIFAGFSASGGGGGSLANWQGIFQAGAGASATESGSANIFGVQGDVNGTAFVGEQGILSGNVGWSQFGGTGQLSELGGGEVNGDVNGQLGLTGIGATAGGSAFLGGQANADGSVNVGPASASGHAGVSAGLGVSASGSVSVSAHKVGFSWNLGATVGLGGDLGMSVSVDPAKALSDITGGLL